jgi:hypothetical protein
VAAEVPTMATRRNVGRGWRAVGPVRGGVEVEARGSVSRRVRRCRLPVVPAGRGSTTPAPWCRSGSGKRVLRAARAGSRPEWTSGSGPGLCCTKRTGQLTDVPAGFPAGRNLTAAKGRAARGARGEQDGVCRGRPGRGGRGVAIADRPGAAGRRPPAVRGALGTLAALGAPCLVRIHAATT